MCVCVSVCVCVSDGHHQTSFFMDHSEFWLVSEPVLPYEEASLFCSSSGSRLASPRSFDSARLINARLPKVRAVCVCVCVGG